MRRLGQNETLHGTRAGQLAVDSDLREAHGLTERESAVAALLAHGLTLARIAERLKISRSTTEKHLASVRAKLGVENSTEAAAFMARWSLERGAEIPSWPVLQPYGHSAPSAAAVELTERLAHADDVEGALEALRNQLVPDGVAGIYFVFLPLNAVSFRRGELIEAWAAPDPVVQAFRRTGGLLQNAVAQRIYTEPDRSIRLDLRESAGDNAAGEPFGPPALQAACREAGLHLAIALGAPIGTGFVGTMMMMRASAEQEFASQGLAARLRAALMLTFSAMHARGLLARTVDLTIRERNVLGLVAQGMSLDAAAEELRGSRRHVSQLLASARRKLGAKTNTEAVAKAMALNALVFL